MVLATSVPVLLSLASLLSQVLVATSSARAPLPARQAQHAQPQQTARRRNVLYIIVDDLRPELGYSVPNGNHHVSTPYVDALAARSMVFDRAYVQQGVCGPTRNSFMTGRRPDTTRVWNFKTSFRNAAGGAQWTALPQAFKEAGFLSAGFGKTYHPGIPKQYDCPNFPTNCPSWSVPYQPGARVGKGPNGVPPNGCVNVSESGETGCASGAWQACNDPDDRMIDGNVTDLAIEQLRKAKAADLPFFINVGIHKPHVPWIFPARFLKDQQSIADTDLPAHRVAPPRMPPVAYYRCENLCNSTVVGTGCFNRSVPFAASYTKEFRRAYRAAVSWMDFLVGRLLTELDKQALDDSTIVAFNGDHGWNLGDHGAWCKQSNFESVARVPLLIHVPGMTPSRTSALVEMVDLMPTLLELAQVHIHDASELEGVSLVPLLGLNSRSSNVHRRAEQQVADKERDRVWKNATFTQYPRCCGPHGTHLPCSASNTFNDGNQCTQTNASQFYAMGYSIRTRSWRYTRWMRWDGTVFVPIWDLVIGEELYDHRADTEPFDIDGFEGKNLAAEPGMEEMKSELSAALRRGWHSALPP